MIHIILAPSYRNAVIGFPWKWLRNNTCLVCHLWYSLVVSKSRLQEHPSNLSTSVPDRLEDLSHTEVEPWSSKARSIHEINFKCLFSFISNIIVWSMTSVAEWWASCHQSQRLWVQNRYTREKACKTHSRLARNINIGQHWLLRDCLTGFSLKRNTIISILVHIQASIYEGDLMWFYLVECFYEFSQT